MYGASFRYGKCDRILHLQAVRRKRQWQLAQMKTQENGLSGVFACELQHKNFFTSYI